MNNKINTVCKVEGSYETLSYLNSILSDNRFSDLFVSSSEMEDFDVDDFEITFKTLDEFTEITMYLSSEDTPPLNAMEYLYNHLVETNNDQSVVMEGEYYNYDYSELGVFAVSDSDGMFTEEDSPIMSQEEYVEEYDDDFYFENEIRPTLDDMKKKIFAY